MINPADRGKVGFLIGGLVVVAAAIAWQLRPTDSAAPTTEQVVPVSGSSTTVASVSTDTTSPEKTIDVPDNAVATDVNPFRTVLTTTDTAPAPEPPKEAARVNRPVMKSEFQADGSTKPFLPPIDGIPNAPASLSDLGLRLDGVIAGKPSVAVIHLGGDSMVLRRGESFGDGLTVQSIGESSVVIGKGKQRITLSVGESGSPK